MTRRSALDNLTGGVAANPPLDAEMWGSSMGRRCAWRHGAAEITLRAQVTEKSTVGWSSSVPFRRSGG